MNWAVLVNPAAGRRGKGLALAMEALRSRGLKPKLLEPKSPAETARAARAFSRKAGVLAVYGGDGTVNSAAAGLAGGRAWLAPLPGGTENVLCRELGLSLNPGRAALALAGGKPRSWDLGFLGGRSFLVVAGLGLDAEVCVRAEGAYKRLLGRGAFVLSAMAAFFRSGPSFSVKAAGRRVGPCWQAVFSNGRRYGGGLPFNPQARPDDGRLDAALIRGRNRFLGFGQGLQLVALGRALGLERLRVSRAEVLSPGRIWAHVDGEPFLTENPGVRIKPRALTLLAPGLNE